MSWALFAVLLLAALAAVAWLFARGPLSLRAEFRRDVARELAAVGPARTVSDEELRRLPEPVRRYLRATGALAIPAPASLRARWRGRIRGAPDEPWMALTAEQVITFGATPSRLFLIDARKGGIPVDVYHRFVGDAATFRVRLASLVPILGARGPEMNHTETVTLFNELSFVAPGRLADPSIRWEELDATSARATFTRGRETISAELRFDADGMLVDFVSDDRSRSSPDGKSFTRMRWSTPLRDPRSFGPLRLPSRGEARWHAPDGSSFAYIELELVELVSDPAAPRGPAASAGQ
jgi:hypothetical protein